VPSRNGRLLQAEGLGRIRELDWWEDLELPGGFRITAVPARHWSQRELRDANQALWCSFVLEGPSGKVFFAGDTGFGTHFTQIREVCGPMRAALLPIGAYKPRAFMKHAHMDPEEAMQAALMLGAKTVVPMHFGTFPQGDEGYEAPLKDLAVALKDRPRLRSRVHVLKAGEGFDLPGVGPEAKKVGDELARVQAQR
jgi:L-ascorbate metabolism protein UlaG (beta-lactamase superfamily)